MTQTKVDVTREAVDRLAKWLNGEGDEHLKGNVRDRRTIGVYMIDGATTLRALLGAKEAADQALRDVTDDRDELKMCYSEARAAAAVAYADGYRDCAYGSRDKNHDATEALRAVKEAVWNDGWNAGCNDDGTTPNPYAKKDTA